MLKEYMPQEAKPDDPIRTTSIMTYELGGLIRALIYADLREKEGKNTAPLLSSARIDLADLITQAYLLSEQMGWKWIDLENDGKERFCERMKEIEEYRL